MKVINYLQKSEVLYEKSGALFIENSLHKLNTYFSFKAGKIITLFIESLKIVNRYIKKTKNIYRQIS